MRDVRVQLGGADVYWLTIVTAVSHRPGKYPWVTWDLARRISSLILPKPKLFAASLV